MSVTPKPVTDHSRTEVDPRNFKINALFVRRLWRLVKPYWIRKGAWVSWLLLAFTLSAALGFSVFGGMITIYTASQVNGMLAKDAASFWYFLLLVVGLTFARNMMTMLQQFAGEYLDLHWREWLSSSLIDQYLSRRTYYDITLNPSVDNPDQRIQEEVGPVCTLVTRFPRSLLGSSFDIMVQIAILSTISYSLIFAPIAYVFINVFVSYYVHRPLIRLNWNATVADADYRYGLLHVRDNAETVAFYRGEEPERTHLLDRLRLVISRYFSIAVYSIVPLMVGSGLQMGWSLVPYAFLAPLFFAGTIDYGTVVAAAAAMGMIVVSLATLTNVLPYLIQGAPHVVRLAEIQEKFDALAKDDEDPSKSRIAIEHRPSGPITLRDVTVQTPGGERDLIRDLTLEIGEGQRLLIVGQTGVGKSSLLRVIAGLWKRGQGTITLPDPSEMMFLPQKPYMILGDLRAQITYPNPNDSAFDDAELQAILERVNLPDLAARYGGFSTNCDWTRLLSLGEQQRIAFARLLASKPRYVFLDEATSALDNATEQLLYTCLRETGCTFISVAHRQSVFAYHDTVLQLSPDSWCLKALDAETVEIPGAPIGRTIGESRPKHSGGKHPSIAGTEA